MRGQCLISSVLLASFSIVLVKGDDTVHTIEAEFWEWRMSQSPAYSTMLGHYAYNDRVISYNMSKFETNKGTADGFLRRLLHIDVNKLSKVDKLNYEILLDTLQTYTENFKWRYYGGLNPVNFLEGLHVYHTVGMANTKTRGDFENYIVQLQLVPKEVEEIIECFQEAIRRNLTFHKVSVEEVPGQLDEMTSVNTRDSDFYHTVFNETLENATNIATSEKESIRTRADAAVNGVLHSFRRLSNYILNEYIPNTRTSVGVNSLENGTKFYEACLRWHLSEDVKPEEVYRLGLQEVDRIHTKMLKIMKELTFEGTVKEFFATLNNNSNFILDDANEIIAIYEDIIYGRIFPKLHDYFEDIPDIPVIVEKMKIDGPGGFYILATESSPGKFSVNLHRPRENPTYDFMSLAIHETFPGHHLQHIVGMKANLPPYRTSPEYQTIQVPFFFPYHSAYVEGWALYCEYLGEEMGLYKDKYEMMGRYSNEILRACRMVVDTGLHVFNWSHEQAVEYLLNYTAYSREAMDIEVDRYITWPGQACSYKFGEIKIKALRHRAETKLGNKFNIRAFHSAILKAGAVPLNILEKMVDDWITSELTTVYPDKAPSLCCCHLHTLISLMSFYLVIKLL